MCRQTLPTDISHNSSMVIRQGTANALPAKEHRDILAAAYKLTDPDFLRPSEATASTSAAKASRALRRSSSKFSNSNTNAVTPCSPSKTIKIRWPSTRDFYLEDEEEKRIAEDEQMYDLATWRMYHRITESRRQRRSLLAMGQALREESAKKTNMASVSQLAQHTPTSPHDLIHILDQASLISLSNNAPHQDDDALFDLDL